MDTKFKVLRKDFSVFGATPENKSLPLIYFDNAATAHKPKVVVDVISDFYGKNYATVHRGLYTASEFATENYEQVRSKVAKFINAGHPCEVVFTKGTTESINFVASTWAEQNLKSGDEILLSQVEHHANLLPWQRVAKKTGAKLKFIEIDPKTYLLNTTKSISSKTKLVTVTCSSNVLGDVWYVDQLTELISQAHDVGAVVLLDAAQVVAHNKLDVQKLNADFVCFSGHKMFGPTGVGVLYIKHALHEKIQPYQLGGSMVSDVTFESATWAMAPQKFESGTPQIASVLGLGAAINYMNANVNFNDLVKYEANLCALLLDGLLKISGIKIAGNIEQIKKTGHLVSFAIEGIHPHDLASYLGTKNIAVRAGHHCAQPLIKLLGFNSLLRVSFAAYNAPEEIDVFLKYLNEAIKFFRSL